MSQRVNKDTLLCVAHAAPGCRVCMVADLRDAMHAMAETIRQRKQERTIDEKFDIGGES